MWLVYKWKDNVVGGKSDDQRWYIWKRDGGMAWTDDGQAVGCGGNAVCCLDLEMKLGGQIDEWKCINKYRNKISVGR